MYTLLLALKSDENICFGPSCEVLKSGKDPLAVVGSTFGNGINLFLIVAGLLALLFMMWGALDWLTSEGEKEKVAKAQKKITNSVIGLMLVFISLVLWGAISGDVLGLVKKTSNGWIFSLPSLVPSARP